MNHRHHGVALALLVALGLSVGCSRYSEISPTAYEYSKALYSVCNRQDETRLALIAEQIASARAAAQLQEAEADWLGDIIASAQAGDWQVAARDARQLMEAQVSKN